MRVNIPTTLLGLGLALTACGRATMPDVAAYRKLAADVSAAIDVHRANSLTLALQDCPAEMSRYDAEIRPLLRHMADMSVEMDRHMLDMGSSGLADMQAGCETMMAELDGHLAGACLASDIQAETARHATAMAGMLGHEMDGLASMQGMMGGWGGGCH